MDFQTKETIVTHVETPIEDHHFTPFASLLYFLPFHINTIIGVPNTIWYEWKPLPRRLEVTVYWRDDEYKYRADAYFDRTAYSNTQIKEKLALAKVQAVRSKSSKTLDNSCTDENV